MDAWTSSWRLLGRGLQPLLQGADYLSRPIKRKRDPVFIPTGIPAVEETPLEDIEVALKQLKAKKDDWQQVDCFHRGDMLNECLGTLPPVAIDAAKAASEAHGHYGSGIGEELATWTVVALALAEYRDSMYAEGCPRPVKLYKKRDRYIADVFPKGYEVWIQPEKEPTQGTIYRRKRVSNFKPAGRLSLILGAGNQINVVILDILHKLICEDEVCIVKMNPQNAFLGIYVEQTLDPFVKEGFVKIVYGGTKEGEFLCDHSDVDSIHLTGSVHTFNQIVYGTLIPTKDSAPITQKRVTGELGCVTPAIIIPGEWSLYEMEYVAETIIAGKANNSGHNCCAFECVVVHASWAQRFEFIEVLKKKFNEKERQVAWYSGSHKRLKRFLEQFPDAIELGRSSVEEDKTSPWFLAEGLSPDQANTQEENWCSVLQEILLPAENVADFMSKAAEFCNYNCWGSLSCSVIIHPQTQRQHKSEFEGLIESLRYGTIIVNAPPIVGFLPAASWGAYPGNEMWNMGSGNCVVHNTSLFDHPEKTVCYLPWQMHPVAIWTDISNKDAIMEAFLEFTKSPSLLNMVKIVIPALRASS